MAEKVGERRGGDTSKGEQSNPQNIAEWKGKETAVIAAEKAGFGNRETLRQAKTVVATKDEALIEAMDSGKLSISAAAKAVSLPPTVTPELRRRTATYRKQPPVNHQILCFRHSAPLARV